ncbi:MAG: hypothetical protein KY462_01980 [Actinobacteria bacterium]|nr:hypothetical protein [Actinomycetota bacterium]
MTDGDQWPWWASGDRRGDPPGGDPGQRRAGTEPPPHRHGDACQVCPICSFLRLVEGVRPDVVDHLTEAARHLTLAAKAVIDAQAEGFARRDDRLERIEVDGE